MILKLTTSQRADIWVNLDQIVQMTTIDVQDGYPSTEIIMGQWRGDKCLRETGRYSELDQGHISRPARAKPCAGADRLEGASGRGWRRLQGG
jgi:hypothetical protein